MSFFRWSLMQRLNVLSGCHCWKLDYWITDSWLNNWQPLYLQGKPFTVMLYTNKHPFDFTAKITYSVHFIYLSHDFTITLLSGHNIPVIVRITECHITVLSTHHTALNCIFLLLSGINNHQKISSDFQKPCHTKLIIPQYCT